MSFVEYKKKKADKAEADEAMEDGEIEDSDPECSIVNIKIESISGLSHRPKARRRDDAWERARRRKRRKLAETITLSDSSESGDENDKRGKERHLSNNKSLGDAILKSESSVRGSQEQRAAAEDLNVTGTESPPGSGGNVSAATRSAAATTTDDPDCLRLQESRVLFSSSDDNDDDDDTAPRRRKRSDPDMASSSSVAQRSFEKIVDSLPENLRANWTWLRQRRVCFRQLELGHCKYKDKYVSRLTTYKYEYMSLQD